MAFAEANGLTVTTQYANRLIVDVKGSVPAVERALHVSMLSYQHPTENRKFFAPDAEPTLELEVPISGISGLDNYALPKPRYKILAPAKPASATSQTVAYQTPLRWHQTSGRRQTPGQDRATGTWVKIFERLMSPA